MPRPEDNTSSRDRGRVLLIKEGSSERASRRILNENKGKIYVNKTHIIWYEQIPVICISFSLVGSNRLKSTNHEPVRSKYASCLADIASSVIREHLSYLRVT